MVAILKQPSFSNLLIHFVTLTSILGEVIQVDLEDQISTTIDLCLFKESTSVHFLFSSSSLLLIGEVLQNVSASKFVYPENEHNDAAFRRRQLGWKTARWEKSEEP